MKLSIAKRPCAILAVFCVILIAGCTPPPGSGTANPVDRYLKSGQAQENRNDFAGALAAYNRALALDLDNAEVHYSLAGLYDNDLNAPEKALFHYLRVLEINPDYRWADIIKDRLPGLRMRVSSGTIPMVPCSDLEQQIVDLHKTLAEKNSELQQQANQNEDLRRRILQLSNGRGQAEPTRVTQRSAGSGIQQVQPTPTTPTSRADQPQSRTAPTTPAPENRLIYTPPSEITHTIIKGDTLYSISRRFNLKVDDIVRANPGLNPSQIKVGQVITIPTR